MNKIQINKHQACQFLLLKHGLTKEHRFVGKSGILELIDELGCIQFDPIDVCGKNAELVLQSRVKGFKKAMLYELLYEDHQLIDYFDKNLAIFNRKDDPCFTYTREDYRVKGIKHQSLIEPYKPIIIEKIKELGSVCSRDLPFNEVKTWDWGQTSKVSRIALEMMYFQGDLMIHHKRGTQKYYALRTDVIPDKENPFNNYQEYLTWQIQRRIESVGLLWNRASDAWLNLKCKSEQRNQIFKNLLRSQDIIEVSIESIASPFYCLSKHLPLLEKVLHQEIKKGRTEFIAPLDNLLWDRKLITVLFDFDYKWEIYTPIEQRKYGYYVLPILQDDRFIGRIEAIRDRKQNKLVVKNIWYEKNIKGFRKKEVDQAIKRLAKWNDCNEIQRLDQ